MNLYRLVLLFAASVGAPAGAEIVYSPDGRNSVSVALDQAGRPAFSVARNGQPILISSPISISLQGNPLGGGSSVDGVERRSIDESWRPITGKASLVRDRFNEAVLHLIDAKRQRLEIVVRAYDDGVALRTILPVQPETDGAVITGEDTGFNFARNYNCWGFNPGRFGTGHEGEFDPIEARHIRDHSLYDLPLLCETGTGALLITESDLLDYPAAN